MSKDRIIPRTPHEVRGKAADLLHAREIAEAGNAFLARLDELIACSKKPLTYVTRMI